MAKLAVAFTGAVPPGGRRTTITQDDKRASGTQHAQGDPGPTGAGGRKPSPEPSTQRDQPPEP